MPRKLTPGIDDLELFRQLELQYQTAQRDDGTWRGYVFDNQTRPRKMIRACRHHHRQESRAYACAKELGRESVPERYEKDRRFRASNEARERARHPDVYVPSEAQTRVRAAYAAGGRGSAYVRAKANDLLKAHAGCLPNKRRRGFRVLDRDGLRDDEVFAIECDICSVRMGVIVYLQVEEGADDE